MQRIIEKILNDVCLDERISDGIFQMENTLHMNALREYFIKKGLPERHAVNITNKMLEGKYPERQAWQKNTGILVTWPTPQYKAKAMKKEPGKYTDQNPFPDRDKEKFEPAPEKGTAPTEPSPETMPTSVPKPEATPIPSKINQGGQELEIEPPPGFDKETPTQPLMPQAPTIPTTPQTPQKTAAEKELVKQIMATDDTALNPVDTTLTEIAETKNKIIAMIYKMSKDKLMETYKLLSLRDV
jgi:hypothetical protein